MDIEGKKCGKKEFCLNPLKNTDGYLPISEFYEDKHKTSGYRSECKKCCNKGPKLGKSKKHGRDLQVIERYLNKVPIKEILLTFRISESTLHRILRVNNVGRVDWWEDLSGKTFDRLTVIEKTKSSKGFKRWLCICVCGKKTKVATKNLTSGHTRSCGCYSAELASARFFKHGKSGGNADGTSTGEYLMWVGAKIRAKKQNVPFNLNVDDIVIPKICPVLGIELKRNIGKMGDNSPTLDKIVPELGYVKGNVAVISLRANRMKGSSNIEEIDKLSKWVKSNTETVGGIDNYPISKIKEDRVEQVEWVGMPEFIQNKETPFVKITIRVDSKEDLDELSRRLEQNLTKDTKSIWFPKLEKGKNSGKRWVDES